MPEIVRDAAERISFPELGYYALPGSVTQPRRIFDELAVGEGIGLGSVWLSERFSTKDVGVLSGVAAAVTSRIGIASGLIANLPLRNPIVVAGYASTMNQLTGGRFALGIGRGVERLARATGTNRTTFALVDDYVDVLRRLWRGETVTSSGPAGTFDGLALGAVLSPTPPVIMAAMGPKTAYWAGRVCDAVVFNALWSADAVAESVQHVRRGAIDAGRDPASVRVWTILMTACDVPEEVELLTIIRRINTYVLFPQQFALKCRANGWDPAVARKAAAVLAEIDRTATTGGPAGDEGTSRDLDDLRRMRDVYPSQWIRDACAVGGPQECAERIAERLEAGADSVVLHATAPEHVRSLLDHWRTARASVVHRELPMNPGHSGVH